ncbi:hypothetical protein M0R72_09420 [Candidatus Pacearchaeota archaeon]|jgi:hypothetical protein|nr:hypothetical protein [Candidatus Pacearchaeota archaeon]
MNKSKSRLNLVEFSRQLIITEDLDPLYIALWKAKLTKGQLCRWLVTYWCYYHAGLCCWASEHGEWDTLDKIARGGTDYPRGTERRHFRGDLAIKAVAKLRGQFSCAEEMVDWIAAGGPRAVGVMNRVKSLYGFGEWIAGKVPDMLERLGLAKIKFVEDDVDYMFSSPKKGAEEVYARRHAGDSDGNEHQRLLWSHRYLIRHLSDLKAPPQYERGINVQETETCFCKVYAHWNGHYPIGKDSHEIRLGLLRYGQWATSRKLLKGLPTMQGGA